MLDCRSFCGSRNNGSWILGGEGEKFGNPWVQGDGRARGGLVGFEEAGDAGAGGGARDLPAGGGALADRLDEEVFQRLARRAEADIGGIGVAGESGDGSGQRGARHGGEIEGAATGIGEKLVEAPLRLHLAAIDHHDFRTGVLDIGEQVRGHQHGFATAAEVDDEVFDFAAAERVEAGGGFIEDDEFRVIEESLGEAHAASHAVREFADEAVSGGAQAGHLDQLRRARFDLRLAQAEDGAEVAEGLAAGEIAIQVAPLRQVAESRFQGQVTRIAAQHLEAARTGFEMAEDKLDQG